MYKVLVAMTLAASVLSLAHEQRGRLTERPQIVGIAYVALQTADLAKARRFYGELLGYPELPAAGGAHVAVFAVNQRQRLIVHDGLPADRDERLIALAFETSSADDLRAYLEGRGQRPDAAKRDDGSGGQPLDLTDPDGHRVSFVERRDLRAATPSRADDRRISRRILHAGLTIRDVASADRFYKDVLGFSEIWRGGRTPEVTSWINMRVPDATEYLEYMLVTAERIDRRQLGTMHHVALVVPDIQEALMVVRSRTAPDDPNHRAIPQIGRNKKWQLNLYDPDGTRIEFMEPWTTRE